MPARDVEKAKALMKEAGVDRSQSNAASPTTRSRSRWRRSSRRWSAEAGFDISSRRPSSPPCWTSRRPGNFQISRTAGPAASIRTATSTSSSPARAAINDAKYCNPEVDKLLNEARTSTDDADAQGEIRRRPDDPDDELPVIYLGHQTWIWALSKKVTGFVPNPDGMIRLQGVKKARLTAGAAHAARPPGRLARCGGAMFATSARRLLVAIPTLLLVSVFVFSLQKLLPGDPVLAMAGEERDPAGAGVSAREIPPERSDRRSSISHWLGGVLQGDFGISLRTDLPVPELILPEAAGDDPARHHGDVLRRC